MDNLLISIIIPFFNAEEYLQEAIDSVIDQSYPNWELFLINDGSEDNSGKIAKSYQDRRITYFESKNQGVSAARNIGLRAMKGDLFCFLDADDTLPVNSLYARLDLFRKNNKLRFVDGKVLMMDSSLNIAKGSWTPSLKGSPLTDLVTLSGKSFCGPSWMIKNNTNSNTLMRENLTHGEDLIFYIELAKEGGYYDFTKHTVLNHRIHPKSAMKNLDGLINGYHQLYQIFRDELNLDKELLYKYRLRANRIIFLSNLRRLKLISAVRSLIRK